MKKNNDKVILNDIFILELMNNDCIAIIDFIENYYLNKLLDESAHSTFAAILVLQKSVYRDMKRLISDLVAKVK